MSNYSRYKEKTPQETIYTIRRILNDIGLFTVQDWFDSACEGAKSCRVTIYPSTIGTNGKGTDVIYSTASGYAELMERLNNNLVVPRDERDHLKDIVGFYHFPDEKMVSIENIAADPDPFMEFVFTEMGIDEKSRVQFLRNFCDYYGINDDSLPCVPFADPVSGVIRYIPQKLLTFFLRSNGMAAGNTLNEAMVQALSEIFERAASRIILKGEVVPPEIPEEEVKKYSFYSLIREVEQEGKYRVNLYDLSMGRNWPVAGLRITDLNTGNFGIKLGAHPSFAIAIERTLTEALQGKNMDAFSNSCRVGSIDESTRYENIPNVAKTGNGTYPYKMLGGRPGWEYKPWTHWEGLDNKGFLTEMIQILKAEGFHPMFRDTSFLGFPSCFIIVPHFSDTMPTGEITLRVANSHFRSAVSFDNFPDLSEEEELRILKVIRFKEYSVLDNQISSITGRQLSQKFDPDKIAAFIALKHGQYDIAEHFFNKMAHLATDEQEKYRYSAMRRYVKIRGQGTDHETALNVVKSLVTENIGETVALDTSDLSTLMQRNFPKMHCYDCGNCPLAGADCKYPYTREILIKVAKAMKKENVDQDKLLEELKEMW